MSKKKEEAEEQNPAQLFDNSIKFKEPRKLLYYG